MSYPFCMYSFKAALIPMCAVLKKTFVSEDNSSE